MKTQNRILTTTHYTYLQPENNAYARKMITKWGSSSLYIDMLIAKDRGDKASLKRVKEQQETFFKPTPTRARTNEERKAAREAKKRREKKTKGKKSSGHLLKSRQLTSRKPSSIKKSKSSKRSAKLRVVKSSPTAGANAAA